MAPRWNIERARELFASRGCELLETEYINDATHMRYIASCGHEHSITLANFRNGKGDYCRACRYANNGLKRCLGEDFIRTEFESAGFKVLNSGFRKNTDLIRYIAYCGHENTIDYAHFTQGVGRVCSACSHSILYKYDYVKEQFEAEDCELLETEYINCKTPMRYIAQCGHESFVTFDVFLNAPAATKRCPRCHKKTYHDNPSDRNRTAAKNWRKAVYEKGGYNCVACGTHGGLLNAHHLDAYDTNPTERFNVDNGVVLCPACHIKFHQAYGFGGNTKVQFQTWLQGIPR